MYIREQLKINFSKGEFGSPVEVKCTEAYNSLKRLSDNHYYDNNRRTFQSSATGLDAEQCNSVLSDEFLDYLKEDNDQGIVSKVFNRNKKE